MAIVTTLDNVKSKAHTHSNKSILDSIKAIDTALSSTSTNPVQNKVIDSALSNKQNKLVSGNNIKTINNNSILGSGNLSITASVPGEVSKITGSGSTYCNIERYNSENYAIKVCHGKVSVNLAETIDKSVTFSSEFTSTPTVIISALINNKSDTRQLDIELTNVGPKGFNFSAALGNTSFKIKEVHYVAIQTK